MGYAADPASDLLDVLFGLLKHQLKLADDEILKLLYQRTNCNFTMDEVAETLLNMDEAIQVIDQLDRQRVSGAQAWVHSRKAATSAYRKAYIEKRAKVGKAMGGPKAKPPPRRDPPGFHCTQQEAKDFLPPGASIWQSRVRGEWCSHFDVPGQSRNTCAFTKYGGSHGALMAALRLAWRQYLMYTGKDASHCPIKGLLD